MRGRWVVLMVIFFFQFSIFSPKISAVEPSEFWKEAIGQYSVVALETQNPEILKPVKISILSKGLLDQIISNQKIKIHVFRENTLLQESELLSSPDEITGFAFVPKDYGNYSVKVENSTFEKLISLPSIQFSIQKNQSFLDLILHKFF